MSCPEITGGYRRKTTHRNHAIRTNYRLWPRVAVQRNSKLAEPEGGFDSAHDTRLPLSPARCALYRTYWSLATKHILYKRQYRSSAPSASSKHSAWTCSSARRVREQEGRIRHAEFDFRTCEPAAKEKVERDSRMRTSRVLRLIAFCLLTALFALWSVSRISAYLSSPHGSTHGESRPSATAGARSQPSKMQFWQVGLQAGPYGANAIGARSVIQTRLPQRVSGNTTDYFWVGSYLADGSFIQAGYFVPWYDDTHAGWFYCAFYPDGREGPCAYGVSGSAGANGADHLYTLEASTGAGGRFSWKIMLDAVVVGKFTWSSGNTGSYVPMIYAESSGYVAHAGTSQLGPVDFIDGLEVLHAGETHFEPANQFYVVYSALAVCPPYGIRKDGHGGILLGSGLPCPPLHTDFD
jgi:hypothetical protein